jgi:hypothetical protein
MHMDGLVVHFGSTHAQKKVLGRREKKEKEKKKITPLFQAERSAGLKLALMARMISPARSSLHLL